MATLNDIIYSDMETGTLDPVTMAYVQNVPAANRATYDLHTQGEEVPTTKYETYYKPARPRTGTIGAWGAADTTGLEVPKATMDILDIGKAVKVGEEIVIVKNLDRDDNTISVFSRGAGWTTAAAHADGTELLVHSVAIPEGANIGEGLFQERQKTTNTVQLMEKQAKVTYTEAQQERKLAGDLLDEKVQEEMEDLMEDLNNAAIYGAFDEGDPSGGIPAMTRGLINSILEGGNPKLVNVTAGEFTEQRMLDTLHEIWKEKGRIDTITLSVDNKRKANSFGSFRERVADVRENRIGQSTDSVEVDGLGVIYFTVDHGLRNDTVVYCNTPDMSKHFFKNDVLRVVDTSDPTNPRQIQKSIMGQLGYNYKNINRNFALDTNLS